MQQDFVNPFGSFLEGFRLGEDDELEKQEALRRQRALDLEFLLNSTERDFQRETASTAFGRDLQRIGVQHGNTVDLTNIRHGQNLQTIGVQNQNTLNRDTLLHGQQIERGEIANDRLLEREDLAHRRTIDRYGATSDRQRTDALLEGILSGRVTGPAADTLLQEQFGITSGDLAVPIYDEEGNLVSVRPLLGEGSPVQRPARPQTGVTQPATPGAAPSTGLPQPRAFESDLLQGVYERLQTEHGFSPEDARRAVERSQIGESTTQNGVTVRPRDPSRDPLQGVDMLDRDLPLRATSEIDVYNRFRQQLRANGVPAGEIDGRARALTNEYMASLRGGTNRP